MQNTVVMHIYTDHSAYLVESLQGEVDGGTGRRKGQILLGDLLDLSHHHIRLLHFLLHLCCLLLQALQLGDDATRGASTPCMAADLANTKKY